MIRLFLIGMAMGVADLVPGVSGGTVALICGIYHELLESIKTLQFQSLRKISWRFLLPVGLGILLSIFLISPFVFYLLNRFPIPLFALFFGMILASAFFCRHEAELSKKKHWIGLVFGALFSFWIASMPPLSSVQLGFGWLVFFGMIASCAMLLPGVSGSYLLQVIGLYPLLLVALNHVTAPQSYKLLLSISLGICLGVICFSRLISWLLSHLPAWTYATLIGFMLGGTRAIWPFYKEGIIGALFCALIGFLLVVLLEYRSKQASNLQIYPDFR